MYWSSWPPEEQPLLSFADIIAAQDELKRRMRAYNAAMRRRYEETTMPDTPDTTDREATRALLVRHRTVMHFITVDNDMVAFSQHPDPEEPNKLPETVMITLDTWEQMGEPKVITAMVEHRDTLNDDETPS